MTRALVAEHRCERHAFGRLKFSRIGNRTAITQAAANSPLRLLTPRSSGHAAWAITSSFGGGLVAGDSISLDIEVQSGASGYVSTQGATRVYKSVDERITRQTLTAKVHTEAVLVMLPDPVVCYADARYEQRQWVDLAGCGGLVWLDWFTSGRHERGERWQAASFWTSNELSVNGNCVLRDRLHLSPDADFRPTPGFPRRTAGLSAMAPFNCVATLILAGKRVASFAHELLQWVGRQPITRGDLMPMGASPLRGADGIIFRTAGPNVEMVSRILFERLLFVQDLLGEHPWKRKW